MWWRPFGRLSKCDIRFPKCGFEVIGGMRSVSPTFFRANGVGTRKTAGALNMFFKIIGGADTEIPHSSLLTPHSSLFTPHSSLKTSPTPVPLNLLKVRSSQRGRNDCMLPICLPS